MMNRKEFNRHLVNAAYDVIDEERLPRPKDIRMRNSLHGTRKRRGTCINVKFTNSYRIIIHTSKAKFVQCEEGSLIDKSTGIKYRRALGEPITFNELIFAMAHEIAHLKFWKHDAQHKSYTEYILSKLQDRLGIHNH